MTDQLALGDVPLVDAPVKFTLEQHQRTKRFFAVMWQLGNPVGLMRAKDGDTQARERLERNVGEFNDAAKRAGLTQTATAGGELVPPVWYVDQYAASLAGHFDKPPAQADLPAQEYSRNVSVIKRLAEDILRRDTYSRWEYDA